MNHKAMCTDYKTNKLLVTSNNFIIFQFKLKKNNFLILDNINFIFFSRKTIQLRCLIIDCYGWLGGSAYARNNFYFIYFNYSLLYHIHTCLSMKIVIFS